MPDPASPRILFVHNALSRFVAIDLELLREDYSVTELYFKSKKKLRPLSIWRQVKQVDLVFGWFASWHTFLPLLFASWQGKKSLLVAGGYDTARIPEARYGNQLHWFARTITNATIGLASQVICNSQFTKKETQAATGLSDERIKVVYHGLPSVPMQKWVKKKWALNVGNLFRANLQRKGIAPFIGAAAYAPEWQFNHAGKWNDEEAAQALQKNCTSNARLMGFVSEAQLEDLYAHSTFYVQPSLHEGFGMSVVEAMQRACVPVVSKHGALPEVVGEAGLVLSDLKPETIAQQLQQLTEEEINRLAQLAQAKAQQKYTLAERKKGLKEALNLAMLN